jgi:hypothetical protein
VKQLWLCLGGPIHGQWRPQGLSLLAPDPEATQVLYSSVFGRKTVAVPAPPVLYRPTLMSLPGWRIKLPVWCEDRLARGKEQPPFQCVLPGGIQGVPRDAAWACRWCYGRPMEGFEICSRTSCITNWASVAALDTTDWRGETR